MQISCIRRFSVFPKLYSTFYSQSIRNCSSISRIKATDEKKDITHISEKALKTAINEANIPVEKYSLSRGLSLNKFEKDFFIFPEFNETDDVEEIKKYCNKLTKDLEESFRFSDDNDNCLSGETIKTLITNNVYRTFVPKEYGGLQFCQKEQIKVFECLGTDFSVFQVVNNAKLAVQLLTIYGTDEQKEKYLQGIGENLIKPAICIYEDNEFDFANMKTEVFGVSSENCKLSGSKINVLNGSIADLYFILCKKKIRETNDNTLSCYIISKSEVSSNEIKIKETSKHLGLNNIQFCTIYFKNINVKKENILGEEGIGIDIASEIIYRNKLQYAGAVIGYMKNLLRDVSKYCNSTVRGNNRLSDIPAVQKVISDLAMDIYILESVTYYIGGLIDENLMILTDIEENIVNRLSSKVLRNSMQYISEISGLSHSQTLLQKEKICSDIITLLAMNNAEMNVIEQISLATFQSWIQNSGLSKFLKSLSPLKALFQTRSENQFKNPKTTHFIAEHVHPSLQDACQNLEDTMYRLNIVIEKIAKEEGKNIQNDYHTLQSLANVVESNLIMTACISRASRSYCIGLRNSDLEVAWTIYLCNSFAIKNTIDMESLMQFLKFARVNHSYLNIGDCILNSGKYLIESPIERNW
uniref:Acyl-CoA dehydrogenase family member 9, mitochondrial (inferred by orthology to a human protein) n=1 Tax=Strongyloides venezuelensis TaxID=75913 RepID=A0A0K0FKP1_STRVS